MTNRTITIEPIIVDLYCRVSTDEQENNTSLDEQERAGREYCAERGYIVGKVWRESYTGTVYRERKDLSAMRERYRTGKIQGVVVRTFDRLSRVAVHSAVLLEEMQHHNITLYLVKENINTEDTKLNQFVQMILAFVAEMEHEKILDRTLTGRVNRAKEGKVVSGTKALYGWQWVYKKVGEDMVRDYLVLDEYQAKVLQEAAHEYAEGVSLNRIIERLEAEGVPAPKGKHWHVRTLRRILIDPRMTGRNVKIFIVKNKRAKQHLDPVELPEGTYPRILSDELYAKVVERANTNAALSTRNSRSPERFLLRAGFIRCAYCGYVMTTNVINGHQGTDYPNYVCPNPHSDCNHFRVPATRLDQEVWDVVSQLVDHVALLEESVELAMKNHCLDDDLRAVEATLEEWQAKVQNYEEDLQDSRLRGDTRNSIRNLLNSANEMVERLQRDKMELLAFSIDRERERQEYDKILAWCRKVKSEREELDYQQKRDFLKMLGVTVIVERLEKRNAPVTWDIKVRLPQVEEIIYQGRLDEIGGRTRHYVLHRAHR